MYAIGSAILTQIAASNTQRCTAHFSGAHSGTSPRLWDQKVLVKSAPQKVIRDRPRPWDLMRVSMRLCAIRDLSQSRKFRQAGSIWELLPRWTLGRPSAERVARARRDIIDSRRREREYRFGCSRDV